MTDERPLLDPDHFIELCDLLGSDDVATLFRSFLRELEAGPDAIASRCAADDAAAAKAAAHSLKGAALSIGAKRIAGIAGRIEAGCDDRLRLCGELADVSAQTRSLILDLLPEPAQAPAARTATSNIQ